MEHMGNERKMAMTQLPISFSRLRFGLRKIFRVYGPPLAQQVQDALFSKMEAIDPQVAEWRVERDQLAERFTSLREQADTIQLRSMAPATNAAPQAPTIAPTIEKISGGEPEE